jgi:hypothetical protein
MSDENVAPITAAGDLADIDAASWAELAAAADRPASAFRYLTLGSVDAQFRPQARMVVLRRADAATRVLEIHTDVRSPKWRELSDRPAATVLGFCPQTRLQLRLQGVAELHAPDSECARRAWETLSAWTRLTYAGGPPGDALPSEMASETMQAAAAQAAHAADGKARFGVVLFRADTLDWFQLARQANRRACFAYNEAGELTGSQWVNP